MVTYSSLGILKGRGSRQLLEPTEGKPRREVSD